MLPLSKSQARAAKMIRALRLFRLMKLVRLFKSERIKELTESYFSDAVLTMLDLLCRIIFICHLLSCAWYGLGFPECPVDVGPECVDCKIFSVIHYFF